jgi:hypothetical protein
MLGNRLVSPERALALRVVKAWLRLWRVCKADDPSVPRRWADGKLHKKVGDIWIIVSETETDEKPHMFGEKNDRGKQARVIDPASEIKKTNKNFNTELELFAQNKLPKEHTFNLGKPSSILKQVGFPDINIEMKAARLAMKASDPSHPFNISDVKDMVSALQEPVAVFAYGDARKAQNIILGIEKNGKNFLVGVHFRTQSSGKSIAAVRGLFPKDNHEWLNWISNAQKQQKNECLYINTKKLQDVVDRQGINYPSSAYLDLKPVYNLLKDNKNVKDLFLKKMEASTQQEVSEVNKSYSPPCRNMFGERRITCKAL